MFFFVKYGEFGVKSLVLRIKKKQAGEACSSKGNIVINKISNS